MTIGPNVIDDMGGITEEEYWEAIALSVVAGSIDQNQCGCCNGTGKVKDANMHFDSEETCMNCLGKGSLS